MTSLYIARNTSLAARMIGGEMVLMSPTTSGLFTLNPVASCIWEAADGQTSLFAIVESHVCRAFDVSPAEALIDAIEFVRDLSYHGVLIVSDHPISECAESPYVEALELR